MALIAGIAAQRWLACRATELWPALGSLLVLGVAALLLRQRRAAAAAGLAAMAVAGALRTAALPPHPAPELDAAPREVLVFSGCIVEPPEYSPDRLRFVLEIEPGTRAQVSWFPHSGQSPPALAYGQRVEFEGRARPVRNFQNPGSYDYARYLARRDVYWTVTVASRSPIRVLPGACGTAIGRVIERVRATVVGQSRRLFGRRPREAAMLEAMLIGSPAALEKTWVESWRRTGTYHALVVSGVQVTVLAAFFLFLLRLCLAPRALALTLTATAAWIYALLCGGDPPVLRAAAGFTLFVAAQLLYRRLRLMNLLAAVAIGFLLLDPGQLFEASFQLSFLAVAAIGALAVPLLEATSNPLAEALRKLDDPSRDPSLPPRVAHLRVELRLLAETLSLWAGISDRTAQTLLGWPLRAGIFFYELAVVSLAVQVGLALPMALYFHRLSLTGLSANLLIGPLASIAVPLGFAALLAGWKPLVWATERLVGLTAAIVEWHAAREPDWRIPDPPWWLAAAIVACLLWAAWAARSGHRIRAPAIALVVLLALLIAHPFPPQVARGRLELAMLDVGQAESIFLALPGGELMLVDAAGFPQTGAAPPRLDPGEDVVSPYLWRRGVRRLDVVVATHGHQDHIGGLPAILRNFRPRQLWFGTMPESRAWQQVRGLAARLGVEMAPLRARQTMRFGGATIEVLAPPAGYAPGDEPANEDSLVLALTYGRCRFLLTGDIERRAESELLSGGPVGRADVLKVAHHGGRTSTSEQWLDQVRPALALISVGFQNSFNLPHPALLERLAARRILTLRTDRHGLIAVECDGRYLRLDTVAWPP
ncbi:MAG: ComEC/Rec2 family competence protein [Bryobacteraceae bacterium]